jgi:hypothetical protein
MKSTLGACAILLAALPASAQKFYKESPLFTTAPPETKSVESLAQIGPIGLAIDLHQPAFTMWVAGVEPGSPADATGAFKKDQVIETINGQALKDIDPRIQLGNIIAAGAVALTSLGDLTTGSIMAGGGVAITARAGADGIGDVVLGNVRSEADIRVSAVGNITAGDLSAANSIFLRATTPVTTGIAPIIKTGNIDTGIINPSNAPGDNYLLFVDSTGTTDVGDVTARGSIGIIAQGGSLITGDLVAGTSITLLDGLGITTGAITTPTAGGVFISSHLQAPLISFDLPGNPDYAALFAATPMRPCAGSASMATRCWKVEA